MRKILAAILTLSTLPLFASTRPFLSDSDLWMLDHAHTVFEVSAARVLPPHPGDECAVVTLTIKTSIKGDGVPGENIQAVDPEGIAMTCAPDEDCLQEAVVFLQERPTPLCQTAARNILGIHEKIPGVRLPVDAVRTLLTAVDQTAWAAGALKDAAADPAAARAVLATTLTRQANDPAVRAILRSLALDDGVDDGVRADTLKVLTVTRSPDRTAIIRDLQKTDASPALKRQSLLYLDESPAAREFLKDATNLPDVNGRAAALILKRFAKYFDKKTLPNRFPVDDPAATAFASAIATLRSNQGDTEKEKALVKVANRLIFADQLQLMKELNDVAVTAQEKKLLNSIEMSLTEVKP